jgi:hypothetical protein
MHTYCKLKDGRIMVVFSENTNEETIDLYPLEDLEEFDADFLQLTTVPYSEIAETDTNLAMLRIKNKRNKKHENQNNNKSKST